jgi:hypothetical protein
MAVTTSRLETEVNGSVASEFPTLQHCTSVADARNNITVRGFGSIDQKDVDMTRPITHSVESLCLVFKCEKKDKVQWRAIVNTVIKLWAPKAASNFLTRCMTISFSKINQSLR